MAEMDTTGRGKVWVFSGGPRTLIILDGEIDIELETALHEAVETAQQADRPVQVDACGVTFLDSSGVTALARLAFRTPAPMILFGAPESVQFLIELTKLTDVIDVRADPLLPET